MMIDHDITLDLKSNTSHGVIEIPQGDINSHRLCIRIIHGGRFFNLKGWEPEIQFYDRDSGSLVISEAVTIVNSYRGQLSYVVGGRLTRTNQRYSVNLKLNSTTSELTSSFIVNVVMSTADNDNCPCNNNVEMTIPKELYDKLLLVVDEITSYSSKDEFPAKGQVNHLYIDLNPKSRAMYTWDEDLGDYLKVSDGLVDLSKYYTKAQSDKRYLRKTEVESEVIPIVDRVAETVVREEITTYLELEEI